MSRRTRWLALVAGLLTSVIWGSSFVLVKVGLQDSGPLTLGGLRYCLAALPFLPVLLSRRGNGERPRQAAPTLALLAVAGILAYPVANGLLFTSLAHLRPATASFVFNQQPLLVLLLGMVALRERPRALQSFGMAVVALGILLYFGRPEPGEGSVWLLVLVASAVAFAVYSVIARAIARAGDLGIVPLTAWPLLIGGAIFLAIGLASEGAPRLTLGFAALLAWLALFNTTLAYLLWNRALQHLQAFEVNVLLALGPIETALIAWPWLHQPPTGGQWAGMLAALGGIALVHVPVRKGGEAPEPAPGPLA